MRSPNGNSPPLWFIALIILLSTTSTVLAVFVVWRRCIKRPCGLGPLSSGISEPPVRRIKISRGRIIRASRNVSLTGASFGYQPSDEQNLRFSTQWPGAAHFDRHHDNVQKPDCLYSAHELSSFEDDPAEIPRRSWPGSRRQSRADLPSDEGSIKASHLSFAADHRKSAPTLPKPQLSKVDQEWLGYPAPLSPITPSLVPDYSAVPLPATEYRLSRCRDGTNSTKPRHSKRPKPRLSSHHSRSSILQLWSSVYRDWLLHPETTSSSKPAKPASSHTDVKSITDSSAEISDEFAADVNLLSLVREVSAESMSPIVSRTDSMGQALPAQINGREAEPSVKSEETRDNEISWLVDG